MSIAKLKNVFSTGAASDDILNGTLEIRIYN